MVPKGGLHTRQVSSVVSGHCHIVLPVPCATRLPPKATSEQMGSSTTGSVVLLEKKSCLPIPILPMTCVMFLCNLVLKENLNKIIFLFYHRYRAFIFSLTFLLYASFHLSRKPISIVKVREVVSLFKHPPAPLRQGRHCLFQYFLL